MQFRFIYKLLFLILAVIVTIAGAVCLALLTGNRLPSVPERVTLTDSQRHFNCVVFSPDSRFVAAAQLHETIRIWEIESAAEWHIITGEDVAVEKYPTSIYCLAFNPKSNTLAIAAGNPVVPLVDVSTRKEIGRLGNHDGAVEIVRFSPCGKFLATATGIKSGIVRLWDLDAKVGRVVFDEKKSKYGERSLPHIGSLAFAPNGKTMAVGIFGAVVFVDVEDGKERKAITGQQRLVQHLTYSPDGRWLTGFSGSGLTFWDAETGKMAFTLPAQFAGAGPSAFAFSPDGKMLAVGLSGGPHQSSYLQVWHVDGPREIGVFLCHEVGDVRQVAWSPDGKSVAVASTMASVKLWDVPTILKSLAK